MTTDLSTPLLLRPEDAARRLGIGRSTFFRLLAEGQVRSVKIGGARRVPLAALDEFVARLDAGGDAA